MWVITQLHIYMYIDYITRQQWKHVNSVTVTNRKFVRIEFHIYVCEGLQFSLTLISIENYCAQLCGKPF